MEQTAIKAGHPPLVETGIAVKDRASIPAPSTRTQPRHWLMRALDVAASLRVTVVLFTLAIFLVYFGTWAQKDAGIWTVVNQYFRSLFVWIPVKILLMHSVENIGGAVPFPGGWLIGTALLINLVAAHAVRFKFTWKRSGIFLIHSGLIVIMVGELVTGLFAVEGRMTIMERSTADYVEHDRATELAIVDRSDPKMDREVVVSGQRLARGGLIQDDALPFDVEVVSYMVNADFHDAKPNETNPATTGIGLRKIADPRPETQGTDQEQRMETPAAYVTIKEKGTGKNLGTFLVSTWFSYLQRPMEEVVVNGKRLGLALRFQREYRDFSVTLLEFRHDKYQGTEVAKNFSSLVRLQDPSNNENRKTLIYMNNPLRYRGETFYQASVYALAWGTVLQVVRNPGWWLPYISCLLVTAGMIVHFGMHLITFLQRRAAA